jgi:hypothetical protein
MSGSRAGIADLVDKGLGQLKCVFNDAESRRAVFEPHLHNIKPEWDPRVPQQFEPGQCSSRDESLLGKGYRAGRGTVAEAAPSLYLDKHECAARFLSADDIHLAAARSSEVPVKDLVAVSPQMVGCQTLPKKPEPVFLRCRFGARLRPAAEAPAALEESCGDGLRKAHEYGVSPSGGPYRSLCAAQTRIPGTPHPFPA